MRKPNQKAEQTLRAHPRRGAPTFGSGHKLGDETTTFFKQVIITDPAYLEWLNVFRIKHVATFRTATLFCDKVENIRYEVLWLCDNSHSDPRHVYHQVHTPLGYQIPTRSPKALRRSGRRDMTYNWVQQVEEEERYRNSLWLKATRPVPRVMHSSTPDIVRPIVFRLCPLNTTTTA